jgi:hypothetical protein
LGNGRKYDIAAGPSPQDRQIVSRIRRSVVVAQATPALIMSAGCGFVAVGVALAPSSNAFTVVYHSLAMWMAAMFAGLAGVKIGFSWARVTVLLRRTDRVGLDAIDEQVQQNPSWFWRSPGMIHDLVIRHNYRAGRGWRPGSRRAA